jgi:hypothetical protein
VVYASPLRCPTPSITQSLTHHIEDAQSLPNRSLGLVTRAIVNLGRKTLTLLRRRSIEKLVTGFFQGWIRKCFPDVASVRALGSRACRRLGERIVDSVRRHPRLQRLTNSLECTKEESVSIILRRPTGVAEPGVVLSA